MKRVKAGDPLTITARDWNQIASMVEFAAEGRYAEAGGQAAVNGSRVVLIKNSTGTDVSRWEILGISGLLYMPTQNASQFRRRELLVASASLSHASHFARFAVAQQPIDNGTIGRAVISGLTRCKVNVRDADHRFADVYKSTTKVKLDSADYGSARIIAAESGTGEKWALVEIGSLGGSLVGTLDGSLSQGSSQDIDSSFATVYDDLMDTGESLASGAKVIARWRNGHLYVEGADTCPAT